MRLVDRFRAARSDAGCAVLEGFHPLKHALRFGADITLLAIGDDARLAQLAASLAPDITGRLREIRRVNVDRALLEQLTSTPPAEPFVAIAHRPLVDAHAILAARRDAPLVFLEAPAHLPNIGACVRVAAAAGAAALLASGVHDPWHPHALRGSAGLHYALPVAKLDQLPEDCGPVVAFDPAGAPLGAVGIPHDAILAFGSERRGLSPALRDRADHVIAIPMRAGVSSLSIATAVAVALYSRPRS